MVAPSQHLVLAIAVVIIHDVIGRSGASIGNGCSDVCDYNEWGKDARCESRNLRRIPLECRNAKTLRAQNNRIPCLRRATFANFTGLKYLYLQGNNLTLEPGSFVGCGKVQQIHLNDNNVPTLTPEMTSGLSSVVFMYVDNAGVEVVLQNTFKSMTVLQYISLKSNKLSAPPCDAFGADSNLRTLFLSNNKISSLPDDCFAGVSRLDKLYLNNNSLTEVNPRAFRGLDSLTLLNLENTKLRRVPTGIFPFANRIRQLHLSFNRIGYLSNRDFVGLSGLEELFLQHNQLIDIHAHAFEFLGTLRVLNISHNSIRSIGDGALRGQTQLEEFALQNNQLNSTKNITFSVIPPEARVRLENNPLHCDCSIYPFMYWLEMRPDGAEEGGDIPEEQASCASPSKFAGRSVIDLSRHDICPGNVHERPRLTTAKQTATSVAMPQAGAQHGTQGDTSQPLSIVQIIAISTAGVVILIAITGLFVWLFMRKRDHYDPASRYGENPCRETKSFPANGGHHVNITDNPMPPDLPPRRESHPQLPSRTSVSSTAPLLSSQQNTGYVPQDAVPYMTRRSTAPELSPTPENSGGKDEDDVFYDKVQIENEDEAYEVPPGEWIERNCDLSPTSTNPCGRGEQQPARSPAKTPRHNESGYVPWPRGNFKKC